MHGALAMFDALGFKGIWKRPNGPTPAQVIEKLRTLATQGRTFLDDALGGAEKRANLAADPNHFLERVVVAFLSDTIVLGVAMKDSAPSVIAEAHLPAPAGLPPELRERLEADRRERRKPEVMKKRIERTKRIDEAIAAVHAVMWAGHIMRLAALSPPALAYRGCISVGEFEVDDTFIVGSAVDDAAEHMEKAQAAIVWLTPHAADVVTSVDMQGMPLLEYDVPLKGGDRFRTTVVNVLAGAQTHEDADQVSSAILETFRGPLDVQIKKRHTEAFLKHCRAAYSLPRQ